MKNSLFFVIQPNTLICCIESIQISLHKNVYELCCVIKDFFQFPNLRVISEVFMTHCIYSYNITYPIRIVTLFSHCLIR